MHNHAPTTEELEVLVSHYTTHKKLPTKYVKCTRSGKDVMMFGTNLDSRVVKFGGIENLLTKFISKEQIALDKAAGITHDDQPKSSAGFKKKERTRESILAEIEKLTAVLNGITDVRVEEQEARAELTEAAAIEAEVADEKQYEVENDFADVAAEIMAEEV